MTRDEQEFGTEREEELRALLRAADPAASMSAVPRSRLGELAAEVIGLEEEQRVVVLGTERPRRTGRSWLLGAAAAVLVVVGGGLALTNLAGGPGDGGAPLAQNSAQAQAQDQAQEPTQDPAQQPEDSGAAAGGATLAGPPPVAGETTELAAGSAAARCQALTPELLAQYDQAFVGLVTAVGDGAVTFTTLEVYQGQVGETVVLAAGPADVPELLTGATEFETGQSYMVAAYQGVVSRCGYSGPATPEMEQIFRRAFR